MHERERHILGRVFNLMAQYWIVQPFRPGSKVQPEQRCADFGDSYID
jgi:hypothetical protein